MSDYTAALKLMKALGENLEDPQLLLPEMLAALGFDYTPPRKGGDFGTIENIVADNKVEAELSITEKSEPDWSFPVIAVQDYKTEDWGKNQPVLNKIRSQPTLSLDNIPAPEKPATPATLWDNKSLRSCLNRYLNETRNSQQLDLLRLTEKVAQRKKIEALPWLKNHKLPSELWLYWDLRESDVAFKQDYLQLHQQLVELLGPIGITQTVELLRKHRNTCVWRATQRIELGESARVERGDLPLPPVGSACIIAANIFNLKSPFWQQVEKLLNEQQVKVLLLPLNTKNAANTNPCLSLPKNYQTEKDKILAALSLTPQWFSLGLVRELRTKLTTLGPEVESDIIEQGGINWRYSQQRGDWRSGFENYQKNLIAFIGGDVDLIRKVIETIQKHIPAHMESILRGHQVLQLAYAPCFPKDSQRKVEKQVNEYYGKATAWINNVESEGKESQQLVGWWLDQATRLGDCLETAPENVQQCFTLAKLSWEHSTGTSTKLKVWDKQLWAEYTQQYSQNQEPGDVVCDGETLKLAPHGTSFGPVLATLQNATHILHPPAIKEEKGIALPPLNETLTINTLKETLTLQTLSSEELYWANTLEVNEQGVTATADYFEVHWPANEEHTGPKIYWRDEVSIFPGSEFWKKDVIPQLDKYGVFITFNIQGEDLRLRYIPPGAFLMGSPENEAEREYNELMHPVTISQGFWLAETTISQALWQQVMEVNPSEFTEGNKKELPVDSVSWEDCAQFFRRLVKYSMELNLSFPSEAQWEYACRAGSQSPFNTGENLTTEQANYNGNYPYANFDKGEYLEKTIDVKAFTPNRWGLYQMHGNLWEWCLDGLRVYKAEPEVEPMGELEGSGPVLRGGGWISHAGLCRSAFRIANSRDDRIDFIGLRAAMVPQAASGTLENKPVEESERPERSQAGERLKGEILDFFKSNNKKGRDNEI